MIDNTLLFVQIQKSQSIPSWPFYKLFKLVFGLVVVGNSLDSIGKVFDVFVGPVVVKNFE